MRIVVKQGKAQEVSSERQSAGKQGAFDTPLVLTVSAAHMTHDGYSAFLAPLLPLLISKLGIQLAAAGLLATVYRLPFLLQPFIGLWADRADARYFVIIGPAATALGMSLIGMAPNYLAIAVLLALAGFSASAFHPAAASTVSRASGTTWGRGSSLYMTGGELGRSIGPLSIVLLVGWVGLENSYVAVIPGILISMVLFVQLRRRGAARLRGSSAASVWAAVKAQRRALFLLGGMILFRSTAITSFATFYPAYLKEGGSSLLFAGFAMSVYEFAGALGALVGGTLSDRFGRRRAMLVSQLLSGPLLYLALSFGESPQGLAALALAGALALSAGPVQLTLAQELLPGGRSTAAGIVFFLNFEGSIFTLIVGVVADWVGLGPALGFSVLASMLSIPFTLAMPEPREEGSV